MGGDASQNGAELFEIEADFSAKIVTFGLVGYSSPPLNPPLDVAVIIIEHFQKSIIVIVIEEFSAYLQLQLLYYSLR